MAKRAAYDADITSKLGDSVKIPFTPLREIVEPDWNYEPYGDDESSTLELFDADIMDESGRPIMMHLLTDALINAEFLLDNDDSAIWKELFVGQLIQMER